MRSILMFLVLFFLAAICFQPSYAVAQGTADNICKKDDFPAFFEALSALPYKKQLDYVKFPLEIKFRDEPGGMTFTKNNFLSNATNDKSLKLIYTSKELIKLYGKNHDMHYQIKKTGKDYRVKHGVDEMVFRWEQNCWKLVEEWTDAEAGI